MTINFAYWFDGQKKWHREILLAFSENNSILRREIVLASVGFSCCCCCGCLSCCSVLVLVFCSRYLFIFPCETNIHQMHCIVLVHVSFGILIVQFHVQWRIIVLWDLEFFVVFFLCFVFVLFELRIFI